MGVTLESELLNEREDLFQFSPVVDILGKNVFVQRIARRAMHEQELAILVIPRQLAEEVPSAMPIGSAAATVLQLATGPEDGPLCARIETFRVE